MCKFFPVLLLLKIDGGGMLGAREICLTFSRSLGFV